jgi:hypothetical protein
MAQTAQLIDTLKNALKTHKKTYADVAVHLRLSEGSVKRLFAEGSFSLERFEQTCQLINMEFSDLVQLMHEQSSRLIQLTRPQEKKIASDRELLLVTVCVLNRWTLADILSAYKLNKKDVIHHLATLDKMQIIELLPGDRIKLLASSNFNWIENGPIQQFFQKNVSHEIFNSRFDRQHEKLIVANAMLTRKSIAVLQKKLEKLLLELNQLNNEDAGLAVSGKKGTTLVMAVREWNYGLFSDLRR